jgi:membrane-bound lytic murein transglycosylase D
LPRTQRIPSRSPPELEQDVRFWIRVYTEVTTDQGLLHDEWNLGLVYEVLRFDPASSPAQRERRVAEAKQRYAALLRRFAAGDTDNLSSHERRILHAFGEKASSADFRQMPSIGFVSNWAKPTGFATG